jgi:signal transduction histidine kinase
MLPILIKYSFNWEALFRNIASSFVPLMIVVIVTLELRWRERQSEIMLERERERQIYMAQIFNAQEDERRRIAQEEYVLPMAEAPKLVTAPEPK